MDASGSLTLVRLLDRIRAMGVEPAMANIGCTLYPLLENVDLDKHINIDHIFDSMGRSIVELFKKLDHEYCRKKCPYAVFKECWTVREQNFKPIERVA